MINAPFSYSTPMPADVARGGLVLPVPPHTSEPAVEEFCRILSRVLVRLTTYAEVAPNQAQEEAA